MKGPEVHRRHAPPDECLSLAVVTLKHAARALDAGDLDAAEWLREEAGIFASAAIRGGMDVALLVEPGRVAVSAHPDSSLDGTAPFFCQKRGARACPCLGVTDGASVRLWRVGLALDGRKVAQEVLRGGGTGPTLIEG